MHIQLATRFENERRPLQTPCTDEALQKDLESGSNCDQPSVSFDNRLLLLLFNDPEKIFGDARASILITFVRSFGGFSEREKVTARGC